MRTTYLTSLNATFNPFTHHGAVPRLFLSLIPPKSHRDIQIKQTILPRASNAPSKLELGFKDGKVMKWSWSAQTQTGEAGERAAGLGDVVEEVERHARVAGRKEELSGDDSGNDERQKSYAIVMESEH